MAVVAPPGPAEWDSEHQISWNYRTEYSPPTMMKSYECFSWEESSRIAAAESPAKEAESRSCCSGSANFIEG